MNNVAITVTSLISIQGVDATCHEISSCHQYLKTMYNPEPKVNALKDMTAT